MRVIHLEADNFKILRAVRITPGEGPVVIGGDNDQGKTSVMDAIWVALKGRAMAPPVPIRAGEEECVIRLDIGEYRVQRKFTAKEGAPNGYTDSVKVVDDRDRVVQKPQQVLDSLLGAVGFDPFEFTKIKPEDQARQLLELVPLPIDLEEFAEEDRRDYATRRDRNRDAEALAARIAAIPLHEDAPQEPVDSSALLERLTNAADTNGAIERGRARREEDERSNQRREVNASEARSRAAVLRHDAARLIEQAEERERVAAEIDEAVKAERERLAALPALPAPVDTAAIRAELDAAEETNQKIESNRRRAELAAEHSRLVNEADAFTKAMEDRERQRREALQKAKMPVEGLGFTINDRGKAVVTYNDLPFSQSGKAVQIRASTAIAMAANPDLRILRITDGSLLDDKSLAIIAEMARDEDFQLWVEVVGEGKGGVIIENGEVKQAGGTGGDGAAAGHPGRKPGEKADAADQGGQTKSKRKAGGKSAEGPLL
ncbi:MAG: AAA family ATPase [Allosphingosinicella sp.]